MTTNAELGNIPTAPKTILLVEDEEMVRTVVTEFLTQGGCHVLVARDGQQALEVVRAHERPIHLLLANLGIPCVTGRQLAETLLRTNPEMRAIFMTGYIEDPSLAEGSATAKIPVLRKPFTMAALLAAVRGALR